MSEKNPRVFQKSHRIRFSECDPAGIVFYPHYFVMFNDVLESWVDSILDFGFTGYIIEKRWGLPTVRLEADFKSISRMGDDVVFTLKVDHVGRRSLVLALDCTGMSGDLRMQVRQTIVCTDLNSHRSIDIPSPLREALGQLPEDVPATAN